MCSPEDRNDKLMNLLAKLHFMRMSSCSLCVSAPTRFLFASATDQLTAVCRQDIRETRGGPVNFGGNWVLAGCLKQALRVCFWPGLISSGEAGRPGIQAPVLLAGWPGG